MQLKIKEEMRQMKLQINRERREDKKALYHSVPLETRREFIKNLHEGSSIKEAREAVNIDDFDVAFEIYIKNIKKITHHVLKQPEEVK